MPRSTTSPHVPETPAGTPERARRPQRFLVVPPADPRRAMVEQLLADPAAAALRRPASPSLRSHDARTRVPRGARIVRVSVRHARAPGVRRLRGRGARRRAARGTGRSCRRVPGGLSGRVRDPVVVARDPGVRPVPGRAGPAPGERGSARGDGATLRDRHHPFARLPSTRAPLGAGGPVLLGAGVVVGWTPRIGPKLGSILTLAATSPTVGAGSLLLAAYALGLAVPFLAVPVVYRSSAPLPRSMMRGGDQHRPPPPGGHPDKPGQDVHRPGLRDDRAIGRGDQPGVERTDPLLL